MDYKIQSQLEDQLERLKAHTGFEFLPDYDNELAEKIMEYAFEHRLDKLAANLTKDEIVGLKAINQRLNQGFVSIGLKKMIFSSPFDLVTMMQLCISVPVQHGLH